MNLLNLPQSFSNHTLISHCISKTELWRFDSHCLLPSTLIAPRQVAMHLAFLQSSSNFQTSLILHWIAGHGQIPMITPSLLFTGTWPFSRNLFMAKMDMIFCFKTLHASSCVP